MIEWPKYKIGDVCELATGGTPSKSKSDYFEGGNIRWLVSGDIHQKEIFDCDGRITELGFNNSNAKFLPENSVMIALNGQGKTRGSVSLLRTKATCNQSLVSINPKDISQLLPEYLHINLHGRYDELRKMTGDSGNDRRGLNMPLIRSIEIPVPSISEQKRIVAILDQAFADIEQARAKTEQNLKNARELFESYLQQVFSQRGEGWEVSKLVDIANVVDSLHKTPKYSEDGYPMVRVTDIRSGALDLTNTRKVDKATYEEFSKKYKAKIGDLVFSRVGSYGRSSIVTTDEAFCLGQNTVFLAPSINGYYFYYFLNSQYAKDQIDKLVAGTTQPTVSLKSIKSIEVPVPSELEQISIVKKLEEMKKEITQVESIYLKKLSSLDELKKNILQKAFADELTRTDKVDESKGAVA